jgi:hypothetical protein
MKYMHVNTDRIETVIAERYLQWILGHDTPGSVQ